jgi:hypothetical protein
MLSRAGHMKEDKHISADRSPQEEHNDENSGEHQAAASLFSSPASTLFLTQLEQLTSQPNLRFDTPAPMWARRLCGRWLLAQRLQLRITADVIAEQVRVDADTLQLLELGLATDIGVDDDRLDNLALLLADLQRDADLVMAVLRVAIGAAALPPPLLERVVGDVRPPPPHDDGE